MCNKLDLIFEVIHYFQKSSDLLATNNYLIPRILLSYVILKVYEDCIVLNVFISLSIFVCLFFLINTISESPLIPYKTFTRIKNAERYPVKFSFISIIVSKKFILGIIHIKMFIIQMITTHVLIMYSCINNEFCF